jgi:O-antigen ligase
VRIRIQLYVFSLFIILSIIASLVTSNVTIGILWVWLGTAVWVTLGKLYYPKGKLPTLILILFLWMSTSIWWSSSPYESWNTLLILSAGPLSFIAWQMSPSTDAIWPILRKFFLAGLWLISAWGIYQVIFLGLPRALGPVADPNVYACLLNLLWFPLLSAFFKPNSLSVEKSRFAQLMLGVSLLLVNLAFFAASSRGATLSWLLLMPLAFWAFRQLPGFRKNVFISLSLALASYLIITAVTHINLAERANLHHLESDASVSVRLLIWHSTLDMLSAHPWLGTGLGTWSDFYPAYRQAMDNSTAGYYAHNDYLQIAQEGGIITFMLFMCIFAFLALLAFRAISPAKRRPVQIENVGLMLGIMAAYLHATVNFIFYLIYINIIVGLYAARVWQSSQVSQRIIFDLPKTVSPSLQRTLLLIVLAIPISQIALHEASEILLNGKSQSLSLLRKQFPRLTPYEIARFIAAIRPNEYIAQLYVVSNAAQVLDEIDPRSTLLQKEVFLETIEKYDELRLNSANSPELGAVEADLILKHRHLMQGNSAIQQARSVAKSALESDPRHVASIIVLTDSYFLEGNSIYGYEVLSSGISKMIFLRDRLILQAEVLKHTTPQKEALNKIQDKLRNIRFACTVGDCLGNQAIEQQQQNELRKIASLITPTSDPTINNSLSTLMSLE